MRYPAWKYILILVVLVVSTLYALPSLYLDEPAVQISGAKAGTVIDQSVIQKAEQILKSENIPSHNNSFNNNACGEMLASMLGTIHNLRYYQRFTQQIRDALEQGTFDDFVTDFYQRRGLEVPPCPED